MSNNLPIISGAKKEEPDLIEQQEQKLSEDVIAKIDAAVDAMDEVTLADNIMKFHSNFIVEAKTKRIRNALPAHAMNSILQAQMDRTGVIVYNKFFVKSYKGHVPERIKKMLDAKLAEVNELKPIFVKTHNGHIPEGVRKMFDEKLGEVNEKKEEKVA